MVPSYFLFMKFMEKEIVEYIFPHENNDEFSVIVILSGCFHFNFNEEELEIYVFGVKMGFLWIDDGKK